MNPGELPPNDAAEIPDEGLSIFDDEDGQGNDSLEGTAILVRGEGTEKPETAEPAQSPENERYGETMINVNRLKHYVQTGNEEPGNASDPEERRLITGLLERYTERTGGKYAKLSDVLGDIMEYVREEIDEPHRSRTIRILRDTLPEFVGKKIAAEANPGKGVERLGAETRAEAAGVLGYLSAHL